VTQRQDVRGKLLPEMLAALAESERLYAAMGPLPEDAVAAARAAYDSERRFWNAAPAPVAEARDLAIETSAGPVRTRLYRPTLDPAPGLTVYLHGGGYVLGNLDTHDRIMRLLARESGHPVLGVDYALAPEHKFPVALDQIAALLESLARRPLGGDIRTEAIMLAGDSAGANLALGTALGSSDRRIRGLVLYYGGFGLRDSASRRLFGGEIDGLSPEQLAFYRNAYLRRAEDERDPRYDGLSVDLGGLPPCFIGAVSLDPLRDDSLALAEALASVGVLHRLVSYDGVLHGFLHYSRMLPLAGEALAEGGRFIRECLSRSEIRAAS
jgi:acetyl esterase